MPSSGTSTTTLSGTSGDDLLLGTSGSDIINSGAGADTVLAGDGNDRVSAGSGDDLVNGGSGSDIVNGDSGNDTLVYTVAENYGARDVYTGGSGIDTVLVNFTLAEWLRPATQTQIANYLDWLARVTNPVNGQVSNGSGSDFTFTFTRGDGTTATLTVQMIERLRVTVDGVEQDPRNEAVDARDDNTTVAEGAATIGGNVLGNDLVPDLIASFAWTGSAPAGLTLGANGAWSFDPTHGAYNHLGVGESADVTVSYTVTDANGDTDTATLRIHVTGTNDGPTAVADATTTAEDHALTFNVLGNDTDPDTNDVLSVTSAAITNGAPGSVAVEADGSLTFNPGTAYNHLAENATATVEVTYQISDGHGGTSSAIATITVTGTNDRPEATADVAALDEDATISGSVAANDTDADDGASLSYALVDDAPAGLTFNADGSYTFDASVAAYQHLAAGIEENVVVAYTVTDQHGASADSTLTITVTGTNDRPIAEAASAAVDEDATITGNVYATDADDGASLTYALVNAAPTGLTFNGDGSYTFDASDYDWLPLNEVHVLEVPFTASDGALTSTQAVLTITITGTNDRPEATADVAALDEDATISGSVAANDTDADDGASLSYALVDDAPAGLTFNTDGSYTFDASVAAYQHLAAGIEEDVVIAYTVTDQHGASADSTLTITVTGTNDRPVAEAVSRNVAEDATITGNVHATDADDGAALTYALVDPAPTGLTFNIDGSYTFDASDYDWLPLNEVHVLEVPFTASDGALTSTQAVLTITITGTNDRPEATADVAALDEESTISGSVATNDTDADHGASLSYALVDDAPAGLTFNADGSYTFDASVAAYQHLAAGIEENVVVAYTVTDQHGASADSTLTITVTGTNDRPVAEAASRNVAEDATITGNVHATDADDGASLTYALVNAAPTGLTFNADGSYAFDASSYDWLALNEPHVLQVPFTASDGSLTSTQALLTITVIGTNDTPDVRAETGDRVDATIAETNAGLVTTGTLTATDADTADTLSSRVASVSATGTTTGLGLTNEQLLAMLQVTPTTGLAADTGSVNNLGWRFDSGAQAFNYLQPGQSLVLTYAVETDDSHAGTDTQAVTITITGTADGPTDIVLTGVTPGANIVPNGTIGNFSTPGTTGSTFSATLVERSLATGSIITDTTPDLTVSAAGALATNGIEEGRVYELSVVATGGGGSLPETFRVITGSSSTSLGDNINLAPSTDDLVFAAAGNDIVLAGAGNDTVYGQNGIDHLHGGEGNDTLFGMNGADTFYFDTTLGAGNVDSIGDFNANNSGGPNEDTIQLAVAQFAGLATSSSTTTLAPGSFANVTSAAGDVTGMSVTGTAARIVFDTTSGALYYDANGGTLDDAVKFAVLDTSGLTGTVDATDFTYV